MSGAYIYALVTPETLAKREKRKHLTVKEWNTDAKGITTACLDFFNPINDFINLLTE